MKQPDITFRPGDALLGIWWLEFAGGLGSALPCGGKWLSYAKCSPSSRDDMPPTWQVWDLARANDSQTWVGGMKERQGWGCAVYREIVERQERLAWSSPNAKPGYIDLAVSDGAALVRRVEQGALLPAWLCVRVIEERSKA